MSITLLCLNSIGLFRCIRGRIINALKNWPDVERPRDAMYRNYHWWSGAITIGWWSRIVVSALVSINEVNLRRAWLVLRWATVSAGSIIPGAGHSFRYVTNQPPKANSAFHPSRVGK